MCYWAKWAYSGKNKNWDASIRPSPPSITLYPSWCRSLIWYVFTYLRQHFQASLILDLIKNINKFIKSRAIGYYFPLIKTLAKSFCGFLSEKGGNECSEVKKIVVHCWKLVNLFSVQAYKPFTKLGKLSPAHSFPLILTPYRTTVCKKCWSSLCLFTP